MKIYMCGLKYPNGLLFPLYSSLDINEASRWVEEKTRKYGERHKDAYFTFEAQDLIGENLTMPNFENNNKKGEF